LFSQLFLINQRRAVLLTHRKSMSYSENKFTLGFCTDAYSTGKRGYGKTRMRGFYKIVDYGSFIREYDRRGRFFVRVKSQPCDNGIAI
jgi:hypothetical protein